MGGYEEKNEASHNNHICVTENRHSKNNFKQNLWYKVNILTFLSSGPDQGQSRFASMPAGLFWIWKHELCRISLECGGGV